MIPWTPREISPAGLWDLSHRFLAALARANADGLLE